MECYSCKKIFHNKGGYANHLNFCQRKWEFKKAPCKKCGKLFQVGGLSQHEIKCDGTGTKTLKKRESKLPWKNCPLCGQEIKTSKIKHLKSCNGKGKKRERIKPGRNWAKGKTYEQLYGVEKAEQIKKKLREYKPSEITRNKLSKAAIKNKFGGINYSNWVGKHGWYKGFWCDSSWELAYVIYNLDQNIPFSRNRKTFKYIYKGKLKWWTPDFIENGNYVEIKGYFDDIAKSKIEQFPEKIILIRKKEIQKYLNYAKNKYGKFISLYEK